MEVRDPITRWCFVCGREWCTCGGPYTGPVVRLVRKENLMAENIATESIWSEPDEYGVRTLLAAPGDPIPEGAGPKPKAKKQAANKAAQPAEDKEAE